jgi:AcrR family transcriptional regulator
MAAGAHKGQRTAKYLSRRTAIVEAASAILNLKGLKGMTFADVGEQVGLVPTGVAYYFASKEALTAACFLRSLEAFEGLIASAAQADRVEDRVQRLITEFFALRQRTDQGDVAQYALFDDVRALGDPAVLTAYETMFRNLRRLLAPLLDHGLTRAAQNARAHLLLGQLLWVDGWIARYDPEDYPRIAERMVDILSHGFASEMARWAPQPVARPASRVGAELGTETFLRAATQLINEHGYVGASVDRISARLEVTKGSFYHHIDAKDDLVAVCFARTTEVIRTTQSAARRLPADGCNRIASSIIALVNHQLQGEECLLRGAMRSLPQAIRDNVLLEYERNAVRFGSMLSDGQLDGSVRLLDVQIGAHMLNAAVNGIGELPFFLPDPPGPEAAEQYVRPLFDSFCSPPK